MRSRKLREHVGDAPTSTEGQTGNTHLRPVGAESNRTDGAIRNLQRRVKNTATSRRYLRLKKRENTPGGLVGAYRGCFYARRRSCFAGRFVQLQRLSLALHAFFTGLQHIRLHALPGGQRGGADCVADGL